MNMHAVRIYIRIAICVSFGALSIFNECLIECANLVVLAVAAGVRARFGDARAQYVTHG